MRSPLRNQGKSCSAITQTIAQATRATAKATRSIALISLGSTYPTSPGCNRGTRSLSLRPNPPEARRLGWRSSQSVMGCLHVRTPQLPKIGSTSYATKSASMLPRRVRLTPAATEALHVLKRMILEIENATGQYRRKHRALPLAPTPLQHSSVCYHARRALPILSMTIDRASRAAGVVPVLWQQ